MASLTVEPLVQNMQLGHHDLHHWFYQLYK